MPSILRHLRCLIFSHDFGPPDMVDYVEGRGTVVVEIICRCCDHKTLGEISARDYTDPIPQGPWTTEDCVICGIKMVKSQTAYPEMWPEVAMCGFCGGRWEKIE